MRGGSRKKMAKKIIPNVPTNRNVYTKASILSYDFCNLFNKIKTVKIFFKQFVDEY